MKFIIEGISKTFLSKNGDVEALSNVNLSVASGEFLAIVGPSGCGKSTLLEIIAGLTAPTAGRIIIDGNHVECPSPKLSMVFQEYALFPWRTALGNLQYVLEVQRIPRNEWHARCKYYLDLVQLWEFRNAYPAQLSGGMKQRVALARALVAEPSALLMDEPFGSLDAIMRHRAQQTLLQVLRQCSKTVISVTHDVDEALLLADRIAVLSSRPGSIRDLIGVPGDAGSRNIWSSEMVDLRRQIWQLLESDGLDHQR